MHRTGKGPGEAAIQFGIPGATIRSWLKRARDKLGPAVTKAPGSRANITVLPAPPPVAPPPASAKVALPPDLVAQAEQGVRLRLARLCDPDVVRAETSKDLREGLRALLEAYDVFPTLDAGKDDDLSTPEAREAALSELRALPEAVRKKAGVGS